MSKSLIPNEKWVIEAKKNVMLIGLHGTGKSACIRSLAQRHGLKVHVLNGATMDPNTELIGIPMPRMEHDANGTTREVLRMIRPRAIDECHILFVDELNRAPIEVQNAVMEIANEGTINGEPLPNLRCVMTAINPPDGAYNVGLIDDALGDRWDVYVEVEPVVDPDILHTFDGISRPVSEALAQWYRECNHAKRETYVSPRRVAKLGQVFEGTKSKKMLASALPPGTTADVGKLFAMLMAAAGTPLKGSSGDAKLAGIGSEPDTSGVPVTAPPAASAGKVDWIKAKHANPAMIGRVEKLAGADMKALSQHFIDMPQSTAYRFGAKLGAMLHEGKVALADVHYTTLAFDEYAKAKGAKTIDQHRLAASRKAAV